MLKKATVRHVVVELPDVMRWMHDPREASDSRVKAAEKREEMRRLNEARMGGK